MGRCKHSFSKHNQRIFQRRCIYLFYFQQYSSSCSTSSLKHGTVSLLNLTVAVMQWYFIMVPTVFSSWIMIPSFLYLLAICISSFKVPVPPFSVKIFVFLLLICRDYLYKSPSWSEYMVNTFTQASVCQRAIHREFGIPNKWN